MVVSRRAIVFAAGAIAAIMVGGYLGYARFANNSVITTAQTEDGASRLAALEQQISRLSEQIEHLATSPPSQPAADNGELRARVDELAAMVQDLRAQQSEPESTFSNDPETAIKNLEQILLGEQESAAEYQRTYDELLETTLAQEEIDDVWSSSVTTYVEETFRAPELSAGQLASTDCRATMCRVEILHDPSQDPQELFMFENELLMRLGSELPSGSIRSVNGPDGPRTIAYFARKGHNLPRLSDTNMGNTLGQ